nr:hypothetical protein Iba_chr07aCG2450 [Ipomoea batatas]GMD18793.1 hypothetical protein Iba_chr07eCG2590 [Ipomoea batatas]
MAVLRDSPPLGIWGIQHNASSSFGLNSSGAEHEHLFASQILSTHVHLGGRRA